MFSLLLLCAAPNIVLIHVDDLGIHDLGCYGRKDHSTPHLDRLAQQGLRFTSAYSAQSVCSPSRAALLTGKHPARLHLTTFLPGRPDAPSQKILHPKIRLQLPLDEITLAEYLKKAGYATACIGKWHLGGKGFTPDKQGFDVVFTAPANTKPSDTEGGKGEFALTRRALRFIDDAADKPFFLYLAHNNPHIPIGAHPKLIQKNAHAFNPAYAAMVETLDDSVGLLLKHLDDNNLAHRTVVVFVSDNGGLHVPELRDDAPTHNTPFRAGKGFLYEGGIRVPLILRWPAHIAPGVCDAPVVATDLMPTLLGIAGVKVPEHLDGLDWSASLKDGGPKPGRELFFYCPHYTNQGGRPAAALRQGDWKLLLHLDADQPELYNLRTDPSETTNAAAKDTKRVAAMRERLATLQKAINVQIPEPNPNWDEKLWHQLYIDTDVSQLKPAKTAAEMTPKLAAWRKKMDAVTRPAP